MNYWGLLAASILAPSVWSAVIMQSSFEQPDIGGSYAAYLAGSEVDGWVVESGSIEVVGTYWQAADGLIVRLAAREADPDAEATQRELLMLACRDAGGQ